MAVRQPRYPKEEFARRGDEIYETQVRSQVEKGNHVRVFDELTSTVPTRVVLLPPVAGAVLGDIVRPTGGTGHLNRHGADSLCIAMA